MNNKVKWGFLVLVLIQALHSIEEYYGELWNVFPPATWLTGLISNDREFAFYIVNIGLFLFGLLSWLFIIRKDKPFAKTILWFWIILELINGIIHPTWSIMQKAYTPGVITAILLFFTSVYLLGVYAKKF